ncbi:MAG TPA: DNA gyrase inhibitor YacG [Polyangia bacterium]
MTGPRCPICKRSIPPDAASSPFRPFCSERCRLTDLGSWLNGAYKISRPISEEEMDQGLGQDGSKSDEQE